MSDDLDLVSLQDLYAAVARRGASTLIVQLREHGGGKESADIFWRGSAMACLGLATYAQGDLGSRLCASSQVGTSWE